MDGRRERRRNAPGDHVGRRGRAAHARSGRGAAPDGGRDAPLAGGGLPESPRPRVLRVPSRRKAGGGRQRENRRMKIGLIAIAGVKLQTRKFIELGVTLPQFVNRGRVIAQLPSLALLTLAGATPEEVEIEYVEVEDVVAAAAAPRRDFDLVALSTYTARAFDAYLVADAYRAQGVPVVIRGLHASAM